MDCSLPVRFIAADSEDRLTADESAEDDVIRVGDATAEGRSIGGMIWLPLLDTRSCEIGTNTAAEHLGHFTRLPRSAMLTRIAAPHAHVTRSFSLFGGRGVLRSIVPIAVSDSSFADGTSICGALAGTEAVAAGRFST